MASNTEDLASAAQQVQATTMEDDADQDLSDQDLDSVDGFRRSLKKKLSKFVCVSGKSEEIEDNRSSMRSNQSSSTTSSTDFAENRTAFVTAELKPSSAAPKPEDDTYNFSHEKRGLAVIINNEDFSQCRDFDDRPGSQYDASSLYHSFQRLGFEVLHYKDLPAWKMVEVLKAAATGYDHRTADCFACAILTHGDQTWSEREWDRLGSKTRLDLLFGVDGRAVATKYVVEIFNDSLCPKLEGKPRLFFLQACRGSGLDHGQEIPVAKLRFTPGIRPVGRPMGDGLDSASTGFDLPDDRQLNSPTSSSVDPPEYHQKLLDYTDASALDDEEEETQMEAGGDSGDAKPSGGPDKSDAGWGVSDVPVVSPAPLYKDSMVMYATPPGYFAWRRSTGAWFVQCLCNVLDSDIVYCMSLVNVLARVSGLVARNYQSLDPSRPCMHEKKAVPVLESMLVKDIVFKRKR